MKKVAINKKAQISLFCLFLLIINIFVIMYIKNTHFPFITMSYVDSVEDFNLKEFDHAIPISETFKKHISTYLGNIVKDKDLPQVLSILANYVRSELFHKENSIRDVDVILNSDEETAAICSGYSKLLVAVADSLGYKARVVWMDGHTVSEIYFPEEGWILLDANSNLAFKNENGAYVGLLYVVGNFDKVAPVRLADLTNNDPDFLSSGKYLIYKDNPILVVIEGTHLFDFDIRSKSLPTLLRYLLFNEPIANGFQYISDNRARLGNLRGFILFLWFFDFVAALSLSIYFCIKKQKLSLD